MVIMESAESDSKVFSRVQAVMDIDFKERHDDECPDSRVCDILDDMENMVPNVEIYFDSGTYEFNGSFDDIVKVNETLKKHDGQRRHYLVSATSWSNHRQRELINGCLQNLGLKLVDAVQQRFVVLEVGSADKMADRAAQPEREPVSDTVPWCYLHNVEPILDKSDLAGWDRDVEVQTDPDWENDQTDKQDTGDPTALKRNVSIQTDADWKYDPTDKRDTRLQVESGRREEGRHVRRHSTRSKSGHQDGTNDCNVEDKGTGEDAESEAVHGYTSDYENETSEDGGKQSKQHKARRTPVTMTSAMSSDVQPDPSEAKSWVMVYMTDTPPSHAHDDEHRRDVKSGIDTTPLAVEEPFSLITPAPGLEDKDLCELDNRTGDTIDNVPTASTRSAKCLGSCSDHSDSVDVHATLTGAGGGLRDDGPAEMDLLLANLSLSQTIGNVEVDNRHSERVSDEKSFEAPFKEARDISGLPRHDETVNNSDQNTAREASEPAGSLEHVPLSHPMSLPRINSDVKSTDQNEKLPPSVPLPSSAVSSDPVIEQARSSEHEQLTHHVSLPQNGSDVKSPDQNEKPSPIIPVPPIAASSDPAQEDFTNRDAASTTAGNDTSQLAKEIKEKADDACGKTPPDGVSFPLTPGDQHSINADPGSVIQSQAGMDSVVQNIRPGREQLDKSEVYNKNQESEMF